MKSLLYYHIADLPGWEVHAREEIAHMQSSGLWDHLSHAHFQLHYSPRSFDGFLEWLVDQAPFEVSWTLWENSKPPCGELYSIHELREHARDMDQPHAILRYHNKGITRLGSHVESRARGWQAYYRYWCVEQWALCQEALEAGYNTVGVNWHLNPGAQALGHWSGNIWWARSDYLAELPLLDTGGSHSSLGGFSPRHDAELWIGLDQGSENRLELHHYQHGCVYNVEPPSDYRLGRRSRL